MGGHLLWYGRVLLEIRGELNGALARVLEVSTDLRLLFLVEVEARLDVVFDAAGEDPLGLRLHSPPAMCGCA